MELEMLMDEAKDMSEDTLMQVVQYMRFLKWEKLQPQAPSLSQEKKTVRRRPGLYQGMIQIADDFDAPLADMKEYM